MVGRIRADLAVEGLIQPTWWILNHVDGSPSTWTPASLTERLHGFDDQATNFAEAFRELVERRLLVAADDGTLVLTDDGRAALVRARERSATTFAQTMQGWE